MHETWWLNIFGQALLPLFVVALLFALTGVNPDLVVRSSASIVTAFIGGFFKLLGGIIKFIQTLILKRER